MDFQSQEKKGAAAAAVNSSTRERRKSLELLGDGTVDNAGGVTVVLRKSNGGAAGQDMA